MAIIRSTVMGKSRKSIGNVTTQVYGGRTIAREKPANVKNPKTAGQVAQRTKMANIVAAWRNQFVALKKYFTTGLAYQSAYNVWCSLNVHYGEQPLVNDAGAVVLVPEGLYLSSGQFPQHFIDVTEVESNVNVSINNAGMRDVIAKGDIFAIVDPKDTTGSVSIQEYTLTDDDVTTIKGGGTLDTNIAAPAEFVVIWYSPSRRMSSTARA